MKSGDIQMKQDSTMHIHPDDQSRQTAEIMRRFNDVFHNHDPSALAELVAEDCVIENTVPAPDGAHHAGRDECVGLWSTIASDPGTRFDLEETFVAGERATIRWRYWMADGNSIRGVHLMRVRSGLLGVA
jgi:ketosteroid isomerase-like protein